MGYEITSQTTSAEICRLLIIHWDGPPTPTMNQVLATELVASNRYLANYRKTSQGQFLNNYTVIVDKDVVLSAGRSTKLRGRMKFNLAGKKTVYNNTGTGAIEKGSFYAMLFSDQLTASGTKASLLVNVRAIWSDNI